MPRIVAAVWILVAGYPSHGVVMESTRFIWQCVPGACPLKEHAGRSADEHLANYEPTLGSLFSDFNSARTTD